MTQHEHKWHVDIQLHIAGARLVGTVRDALGGPVAGAVVQASTPTRPLLSVAIRTDDDGTFSVWLPRGPVILHAEAEGYAPADDSVVAPSDQAELILTPESRISGHVVSATDGKPVLASACALRRRGF